MNIFAAEKLAAISAQCHVVTASCDVATHMLNLGQAQADRDTMEKALVLFQNFRPVLISAGLSESIQQLDLVEMTVRQPNNASNLALSTQIQRILDTLIAELRKRKFIFVAADRTFLVDNKELFGVKVNSRFNLAAKDIEEAGNCLAAECNTAAVFHLMCAFEWALRAFAAELGLSRFKDWNKEKGRFQYTPASYVMWEKMLSQLPQRAEKRLRELRPGPRKQALQQFYSSCFEDIKFVKDAWRNHIMHTRQQYDRDQAVSVLVHVMGIMQRMANGKKK
jgi:hypothetical protein